MPEKEIQNAILIALSEIPGCLVWRQQSGTFLDPHRKGRRVKVGVPGMSDIGAIYRGLSIQIEVKDVKKRQSDVQRRWQAWVERAGGIYRVCRSVDDAIKIIEEIKKG